MNGKLTWADWRTLSITVNWYLISAILSEYFWKFADSPSSPSKILSKSSSVKSNSTFKLSWVPLHNGIQTFVSFSHRRIHVIRYNRVAYFTVFTILYKLSILGLRKDIKPSAKASLVGFSLNSDLSSQDVLELLSSI